MKKLLPLVVLLSVSFFSHAQKGNNQVNIGPEIDLPVGALANAYKVGFGATIKGLYGVGTHGQITLMTGFSSFKGKSGTTNGYSYAGQTYNIIPFLLGYRNYFKLLYVEPQLGYASYITKASGFKFNGSGFTYGAGVGYAPKDFDLGLRFQSHEGSSLVALRAAYTINLKSKK